MSQPPIATMLDLACELAVGAGKTIRKHVGQRPSHYKADKSVVTETDHLVQEQLVRAIHEMFPEHAVLGEENLPGGVRGPSPSDARFCWVLDPIDGTRNFVTGFPCYGTCIAVLDRAEPIIGVVAEHALGDLYRATRGGGAWCNDRPMQVRAPHPGEDMLVGTPSTKEPLTLQVLDVWLKTKGIVFRNTGSTAAHLALVARGSMAAAFSKRCKIWDIAAGMLLVTEAGGVVTSAFGEPLLPFNLAADHPRNDIPFLCGEPAIHAHLLPTIPRPT
ncbi:MAG: inositol monophosphatase [Phycisphaerae bacterium]|nr:inositol monophosphatase [Phycisphaerae bacterium]